MTFSVLTFCIALWGGTQGLTIETIKNEVDEMAFNINYLPDRFQADFEAFRDQIEAYESSPNNDDLEEIQLTFAKLQYGYELLLTINKDERRIRQMYFDSWHKVSQLKKRVDNLYISKAKGGNQALMIESEISNVRKKPIYEAYSAIYQDYGKKLKAAGECDHRTKTELVNNLISLLQNAEKLLDVENTRAFEKELKKLESLAEKEVRIVNYAF
ncbi:MAG: hypothetical protein R8G66_23650 [Cytophagales bacterium]|nr:hypothetical protein [Cytophagales bacterium]